MKKIFTVLIMTLMMAGSLFAYEPKPEFFNVWDNIITYKEVVEPQYGGSGIRCFLATRQSMEKDALVGYRNFEYEKTMMLIYFSSAEKEADEEKKEEYKNKAIECKNRAINEVPFITEKNFWTMNEQQYIKIFCKYLKKIHKAELKKQKLSK